MSQIRSDILFTRKIKEARECEHEIQRLHIATPICPDDEVEEHELNELDEEEIVQVSDDENGEGNNQNTDVNGEEIITDDEEQRWSQLIEEWIELGNRENHFENNDEEIFLSTEWNSDFNLAGREVHPADDKKAKWSLITLFESSFIFRFR
jgi:hypothetical protein